MGLPFSRIGQPIHIPVSATSAMTPYAFTLPANAKTFIFINPNPFDCRLEGYPAGAPMTGVTWNTGWMVLARMTFGPFRTKSPVAMSAQAFGTKGNPLVDGFDYTGCFLELHYGDGE